MHYAALQRRSATRGGAARRRTAMHRGSGVKEPSLGRTTRADQDVLTTVVGEYLLLDETSRLHSDTFTHSVLQQDKRLEQDPNAVRVGSKWEPGSSEVCSPLAPTKQNFY